MRRPVCFAGLVFVLILIIYMYIIPYREPSFTELDGIITTVIGQVDKKEYRISYGQEILIIYLKKVQVLNPQTTDSEAANPQLQGMQQASEVSDISEIEGILCYMETDIEPKLGSYVRIKGKFKEFAQASNPGEFDARSYYNIIGMQIRLQKGVILEESASYSRFREKLWELKKYLAALTEICFEEDAHIMKAMLLGEKSGIEEETKLLYQLNGIIHILSISGLHISMIGMGLYKLLGKLKCYKIANVIISLSFMYCYGVMTGMSISAVRAIVMFGFHITAGVFGRTYDMLTAMAIVGIAVLLKQPLYLHHSGFLFSFGAILAIGLFLPAVGENLFGDTKLEKIISTSLSVSIVTFPVYLCFYYEYPLYSVFLNLIIIPGTTLIMADGLMGIAVSVCCLPMGKYVALPARIIFRFYEMCCNFTLHLPGSRSILGKAEIWQSLIFILIVSGIIIFNKRCTKLQFWQWILAALLCITLRFQDGLEITVLDVGQGDGIYIADEYGGHYLIDSGSSSKKNVGTYQVIPFLKSKACKSLDAVFVTHMDSDHYNGIPELIEDMAQGGIQIKNLVMPDLADKSRDEAYHELVRLAQEQGIRILYIGKGETIRHGQLQFACLHPEIGEESTDTNASSIVLYLKYEVFSALFTGDLEDSGEDALIRLLEGQADEDEVISDIKKGITLLKVAHHGSRNSTPRTFLELTAPRIALISAGKDNSYGHPHEETLERLEEVKSLIYRTDEGGALTVKYKDGRVSVECFSSKQHQTQTSQ